MQCIFKNLTDAENLIVMKSFCSIKIVATFICVFVSLLGGARELEVDVLVIGGGASGVSAGIQAARMGAKTAIVEESPWVGGMLTAAGVSAIDGNYNLPAGMWANSKVRWKVTMGRLMR